MEGEMQLSVTPFLSNHAVLQRDEEIVVRGRGHAGCEILQSLRDRQRSGWNAGGWLETAEPGAWYFRRFRPEGRMNCG